MRTIVDRAAQLAVIVFAALGCTSLSMGGADPEALQSRSLAAACPLGVPGTSVRAFETKEGAGVHFSTRPANVEELRQRVQDQARVNGPDRHRGRGHFGEHKGARDHGLRLWTVGSVEARVEETPTGATLWVAAVSSDRRTEVRDAVFQRAASIRASGCF